VEETLLVVGSAVVASVLAAVVTTLVFRRRLGSAHVRLEQAERSLRDETQTSAETREVQGLILSSMEEGVLLVDRDGHPVFSNDAFARHVGEPPADTDARLPAALQRAVQRAGYTGAVVRAETETGVPSRWLRATALPVGDDGAVLLVVRDVTDARRLDAVRRDFVANASHELKTPVASIRAAAETLRDGAIDDPPAARRFTEQLDKEALRLSRIVSDLLDLSRLETGSDLQERVRMDAVAADEVERLEERAADAGITLTLQADGVPSVLGSGRDLALMLRNLVDNAVRYTPAGGQVQITIAAEGDAVVVRVRDTGVGIPQRDVPRIFERFYRVDRARSRDTGGTGLGLAIVKHVAENHGGEVVVDSELAQGSTFEVRLPAAGLDRSS